MNTSKTNETDERETRAYEKARSDEPEHSDSENVFGRSARTEPEEADPENIEGQSDEPHAEDEREVSIDDFITAERARPDIPEETVDGLNELEEEVRRQAEDRALNETARRDR